MAANTQHAMQQRFTRRNVLNGASCLVAATALGGGLIRNGAVASEGLPGHAHELTRNPAFEPIDQMLQHAADSKTVGGVVALGATEKEVV